MCIRDRLGGVLAYFVSGRALRPLRSFAAQVESVQPDNLADTKISDCLLYTSRDERTVTHQDEPVTES